MSVPDAPSHWIHDAALKPVVETYIEGGTMTPAMIAAMRGYLREWVGPEVINSEFEDPGIDELRASVRLLKNREDIDHWLDRALDYGIDPL